MSFTVTLSVEDLIGADIEGLRCAGVQIDVCDMPGDGSVDVIFEGPHRMVVDAIMRLSGLR